MIGVTHPTFTSILESLNILSLKKNNKKTWPVKNLLFKTEIYSSKSLETDNSDKIREVRALNISNHAKKSGCKIKRQENRASRIT